MTSKSLTASAIGTWKKLAVTTLTHFVFSPLIFIVHAVWLVGVLCVLLPWLSLDFLPKRRSKQLTSPPLNRRKLQTPLREGSDIFVLNPDGTKVPVTRLEAVTQARAWNDVCFGAFVAERPTDKEDAALRL